MAGAVLVTGAAGFAGSHLLELINGAPSVRRSLGEGGSRKGIVAWSRSAPPPSLEPLAAWQRVDLLDKDRVREAIEELKPSAVYHCAGAARVATSWSDTAAPLATNVLATHYLFDALRRAATRCRVLVPGSAMIYRPATTPLDENAPLAPSSPYAVSKLAQEQLGLRALAEDGLDVIVTRSFNHTGPRQGAGFFAPDMARQIADIERGAEPVIGVGNLDAQRDLTDVRDIVRAYALLMDLGMPGTVYNVASGVSRPMRAVLDGLVGRSRIPVRIETDPQRMRPHDVAQIVGDASRLRQATGWAPEISFERMLDDLLNYWRAQHDH